MASLFFMPFRPAFDSNAKFIPGAQVWFTLAGTNTPTAIYTDAGMTTPQTNPVVASATGRIPATYLDDGVDYRVRVYDENAVVGVDTPIEDYDPYTGTFGQTTYTPTGTGAVTRSINAKLDDIQTVRDYGATGDGVTNDKAAFEATSGGTSFELVPPGTYLLNTTPTLTKPLEILSGAVLSGAGAAALGYASNAVAQSIQPVTAADQFAFKYIRRNANHAGGTAGFTSAGLRVDTYVGAAVTNYEWAILAVCDNSAPGGENVGGYFQGIKRATGPTWGMLGEVIDHITPNPGSQSVGGEFDITANGTDNNNVRVGVDSVIRRRDTSGGAAAAEGGWAFRIQNNGVDRWKTGYGAYNNTLVNYGFDASQMATSIAAFKMKANQVFVWSADDTRKMYHTGGAWAFANGASVVAQITDTGAFYNGANQVVGARQTGCPAAATDLATALALVNFIRAAGLAHGLWS